MTIHTGTPETLSIGDTMPLAPEDAHRAPGWIVLFANDHGATHITRVDSSDQAEGLRAVLRSDRHEAVVIHDGRRVH